MAKLIAQKLGLIENIEPKGECLGEKELLENKIRKVENRIARYIKYAENARKRCETMQAEFNKNRGDISWLTQPNVNSSTGRAFTNSRNRIIERYRKGFDEFNKAKYFDDKAKSSKHALEELLLKLEQL